MATVSYPTTEPTFVTDLATESDAPPLSLRLTVLLGLPFIMLLALGSYRTYASHEVYVAATSIEMLRTGDWVIPKIAKVTRFQKPPLGYWTVATLGMANGEVTPFLARLPQALASLGLAALVGFWVARWYGSRVGWFAALMQGTTVFVVYFGRRCEVDLTLCLATTGIMALVIGTPRGATWKSQRSRYFAVWLLLSICWLYKFHYGPAMTLAPIGLWLLIGRDWRGILHFLNPAGIAVFVAAMVAWPWMVLQRMPNAWDVWRVETVGRAVGELSPDPFWYFLPHLVTLSLPWLPWAVRTVPESWRAAWKTGDRRQQFLWIWILTDFAIITAQPDKHPNYLIAFLPALTLLAAPNFVRWWDELTNDADRMRRVLTGNTAIIGSICAVGLVGLTARELGGPSALMVAFPIFACVITSAVLFWRDRKPAGTIATAAGVLFTYAVVMFVIFPARDHRQPGLQFAAEMRREHPQTEIILHRMGATHFAIPLGSAGRRADTDEQFHQAFDEAEGSRLVFHLQSEEFPNGFRIEPVRVQTDLRNQKHEPLCLSRVTRL